MRVLIASDSFKGSLNSQKVGEAVAEGIRKVFPGSEVRIVPMADGGEGTVEALVKACSGKIFSTIVSSPIGESVEAVIGMLPDNTAVIEMASASGLTLVPPDKRNPLITSTRGTGELIKFALDLGARRILIGIGGSATNDGGAGMAQALGARLLDKQGKELEPGGASLIELAGIDTGGMDARLKDVEIIVMCDVDNPLCGTKGASAVYGPQKGATPEMVEYLDKCLVHYAEIIKEYLGKDIKDVPGAGAAGGLGAGLLAFTNAVLKPGTEAILEAIQFDALLTEAELVVTGEGRIDYQSAHGKVPKGVAVRAQRQGKPVIAIVGSIGQGAAQLYNYGISSIVPIVDRPMSLEEAVSEVYELTVQAAERAFRLIKTGHMLKDLSLNKYS